MTEIVDQVSPRLERLDEAQRELLRQLIRGRRVRDIAQASYVSPRTVKRRIADLLDILGVDSRMEAAYLAGRGHLFGDEPGQRLV